MNEQYRAIERRWSRLLVLTIAALLWTHAMGCEGKAPSEPDAEVADASVTSPDQRAIPDIPFVTADSWTHMPDVYAEPGLSIHVRSPAYMSAGPIVEAVTLRLWGVRKYPKQVLEVARAIFSLHRHSGEVVPGTMEWAMPVPDERNFYAWNADARWIPDKPLDRGDYVAVLDTSKKEADYVNMGRERHVFHVGEIARVRSVSAFDSPSGVFLNVLFTAWVKPTEALAAATLRAANTSLSLVNGRAVPVDESGNVLIKLPPDAPLDKDLTLKLGTDVGAVSAGLLDGLYTGVAGSGPFELTIPKNSIIKNAPYEWWPSIPLSF